MNHLIFRGNGGDSIRGRKMHWDNGEGKLTFCGGCGVGMFIAKKKERKKPFIINI